MSKLTLEITAKLADLEKRIRADWKAFEGDFKQALSRADDAAVSGWQIGAALKEAKGMIRHGEFSKWYGKLGVPERTGQRFMAAAREFPELKDFMANRREMMLSTGLLADKESPAIDGNISTPVIGTSHAPFLTKFLQWTNEAKSGKIKIDQDQIKNDLRPVYEWLKGLYGE